MPLYIHHSDREQFSGNKLTRVSLLPYCDTPDTATCWMRTKLVLPFSSPPPHWRCSSYVEQCLPAVKTASLVPVNYCSGAQKLMYFLTLQIWGFLILRGQPITPFCLGLFSVTLLSDKNKFCVFCTQLR